MKTKKISIRTIIAFGIFLAILVVNESVKKTDAEKATTNLKKKIENLKCGDTFKIIDSKIITGIKDQIKVSDPEIIELAEKKYPLLYELDSNNEKRLILEYCSNDTLEETLELSWIIQSVKRWIVVKKICKIKRLYD
jgi:hypothetical protein